MTGRLVRLGTMGLITVLAIVAVVVEVTLSAPSTWGLPGIAVLWATAFGGVGFLIARRESRNPIGWLLLVAGVIAALLAIVIPLLSAGRFPDQWAGFAEFVWVPTLGVMVTALALLPDGSLPSPRWRPVVGLLWIIVGLVLIAALPGSPIAAALPVLEVALQFGLAALLSAAVVRFRRSQGTARQQLKWIALVVSLVAVTALLGQVVIPLFIPGLEFLISVALSVAILAIPVAIAFAIFRYRLYDIDRLISRTVSYGVITAVLVGVYMGVVFVLRALLPVEGELEVAGSTLAVAALFYPLRNRVQGWVDRHFNRARYDAVQTLEAFAERLRSQMELVDLGHELRAVAAGTVEPSSVSLWLRQD